MMKKTFNYFIIFLLLIIFVSIFKYSILIKKSIISSCLLWATTLIPSMLPIYIIIDLLINYGLSKLLYRIFKTNSVFLVLISLITGTPSNAKYIREFYKQNLISKKSAELILLAAYSPNPLFIINISPSINVALKILSYIYITNIILFILFKKKLKGERMTQQNITSKTFSDCLSSSIKKSFDILILILGIISVYGVVNILLDVYNITNPFIVSILELTNALNIIVRDDLGVKFMILASTIAGASIHTQIKSILEDTDISYKYFLLGRILSCIPIIFIIIFF